MSKEKADETVGERIARLRTSIGASREDMAAYCGITRQTISMWENGETKVSAENLFTAAEFLGVSAHELWFGRPAASEGASIPEFDRVTIQSRARLVRQALEWIDNLKAFISELEPRRHASNETKTPTRPSKKSPKKPPRN